MVECHCHVYARGLCRNHYNRARSMGILEQYPRIGAPRAGAFQHPKHVVPLPDIPETCAPIIPNPPQYRPWRCQRAAVEIEVEARLPSWSAWEPMRERMLVLEKRDAARDAADDAANPDAVAEYARQAARWRAGQ